MSKVIFNSFIVIAINQKSNKSKENVNNAHLNGISVSYSDDFDCINIKDYENNKIGILIGNPISDSIYLAEDVRVDRTSWESFENTIYDFSGRFIAIGDINCQKKVYLDASGTLPLVYDPKYKMVASSAELIYGDSYDIKLDTNLLRKMGMPRSGLWFPSGITAHKGLRRLMPNHYLNLDQWTTKRHWPLKEFKIESEPKELISNITENVQNTCAAIATKHTPVFSITAGRDSRMLLACNKNRIPQSKFFTFSNFPGSVDMHYARIFRDDFGLHHCFLRAEKPPKSMENQWLRWNGHCISGEIWKLQHSLRYFSDSNHAILPAMAGEVGRAFYWKRDDKKNLKLTANELLKRLSLPQTKKLIEASKSYINGLPDLDFFSLLDLVYIEQRLGCWGNLSMYTGNSFAPHFLPLSSRAIFTNMISLPAQYKVSQEMPRMIIQKEWPELLQYPFNKYQGVYKSKKILEYVFLIPSYVYRKMKLTFS